MRKLENAITKFGNFIEKNYKICFWIIFALAFILNTYKIGQIPNGIHCDEAGMTYDAYCIANYGVDRFLNKFPVYFINYGDGQNALYTYLTAILIKIFGKYNLVIIRIPALILSMIEVCFCYLIVSEFFSKKSSLFFMLLVTIQPWHIMKSRWGLESFILSPMQLISTYTLIKAVKSNKKRIIKYFIAGTMFGLTLYTYAVSYITIPLFLLIMLIYLIKKKAINIKEIITFLIPFIIFGIPLVLVQLVQKGYISEIHSFITIPELLKYRSSDINIKNISKNLKYLKYGIVCDYLSYNSIKDYGLFYYFGNLLIALGFFNVIFNFKKLIKKDGIQLDIIMFFLFISSFILTFLIELNANRFNGIFIPATYLEFVGLREIYYNYKTEFLVYLIVFALVFMSFLKSYFVTTANSAKVCFSNGQVETHKYLEKYSNKKIYGEDQMLYTYKIYGNPISPYEFNKEIIYSEFPTTVLGYKNYISIYEIDINNIDQDSIYITYNASKAKMIKEKYNFKEKKIGYIYILAKELD